MTRADNTPFVFRKAGGADSRDVRDLVSEALQGPWFLCRCSIPHHLAQFGEKSAGLTGLPRSAPFPAIGKTNGEGLLGARDPDICESPLFFDGIVCDTAPVW